MAEKLQNMLKREGLKVYSTTITPRPPFFLFVPDILEVNPELRKQNEGKAFALGEFFNTDEEAIKAVKRAGYNKKQQELLEQQGYLAFKGDW